MRAVRLLAVGRLKTPHFKAAAAHYVSRLARSFSLEECLVKDADPALPPEERKQQEAERLLKLIRPADCLICLDEHGDHTDSRRFAASIRALHDKNAVPTFVLGGAYGLAPDILNKAERTLSFSPMTFPHELARVMLLEQLYRATQILANTGYHH